MIRVIIYVAIFGIFFSAKSQAKSYRIIAIVNNVAITEEELIQFAKFTLFLNKKNIPDLEEKKIYYQFLWQMIDTEVVAGHLAKNSANISNEMINESKKSFLDNIGFSESDLYNNLQKKGLSKENIDLFLKNQVALTMIFIPSISADLNVTENEILQEVKNSGLSEKDAKFHLINKKGEEKLRQTMQLLKQMSFIEIKTPSKTTYTPPV